MTLRTFKRALALAVTLLGALGVFVGAAVAVTEPNGFPGVVLAFASGCVAAIAWEWLADV